MTLPYSYPIGGIASDGGVSTATGGTTSGAQAQLAGVNPLLGYDPSMINANGIQTREQWIAATAQSMTAEFAYADGTMATSPLLAQTVWQQAGVSLPPQNLMGASARNPNNQLPGSIYLSMYQVAAWAYDHPGAVPGVSVPTNLPSGGPLLGDADKAAIASATQNQANNAERASETAANNQNAIDVANINNTGANARDAADNAAALERAQLQATVDRESIASNERIASADRASRESIANADRAEQGREFDLNLTEDRRQFNATALTNLLQIGVNLAEKPVDWLGLQFFTQNMGIPATALNLTTAAILNGAVPPTGPSEAGPVTSGPAAIDGDTTLAQMAGVQAAFVPVQQAVQQNPGIGSTAGGDPQAFTASANLQRAASQVGGLDQVIRAVAQGRSTLAQVVGANPVTEQAQQLAQQELSQAPTLNTAPAQAPLRFSQRPDVAPQPDITPAPTTTNVSPFGRSLTPQTATPTTATTPAPAPAAPPAPQAVPALAVPTTTSTPNNTGATENTGVYTGQQQQQPSTNASAAAASPYGSMAIINAIAGQLGISPDQVAQLVPPNLLPTAATPDQLAASPVIQSLQTGGQNGLSQFRTAPADGSKFASLQAFGVPLGNFRGGQDYNAQTFLNANPSTQQQLQGAVNATGQYFPDFQKQLFQSSPLTNYDIGAFGKRVF